VETNAITEEKKQREANDFTEKDRRNQTATEKHSRFDKKKQPRQNSDCWRRTKKIKEVSFTTHSRHKK
jgi:hypothetical protein